VSISKQGVALPFRAFFVASKTGKTGLTVTVDVRKPDGTLAVTGASATERGGGWYSYSLSGGSNDADGTWEATFKTTDTTVDQQHLPSLWIVASWVAHIDADISDAAAGADPLLNDVPGDYPQGTGGWALGRVKGELITTSVPVASNGKVTIDSGDDYKTADGRALQWQSDDWSSLSGATIELALSSGLKTPGSISGTTVSVELTAAQTRKLRGKYRYALEAAKDGRQRTLAVGTFEVRTVD